jgi:hypothetical protein
MKHKIQYAVRKNRCDQRLNFNDETETKTGSKVEPLRTADGLLGAVLYVAATA